MQENNQKNNEDMTKAVVKKPRRFTLVWVIPLLAMIITAMLIWNNTINVGPVIKITMADAEGMEAGKTLVKFRSVVVGTVKEINLSQDFSKTVLTVQMKPDTKELLNHKTKFWVVKPRIENTSVSGLETILSGAYLQLLKGDDKNFEDEFVCLDTPPVSTESGYGKNIYLESPESKKVQLGDPLIYKGFKVGSVTYVALDTEHNLIRYTVYIEEKYKHLVGKNSVFWIYNGLDFSLGASGIDVSIDSIQNILQGGIVFDNLDNDGRDLKSKPEIETYTLYDDKKKAHLNYMMQKPNFVVMVDNNLKNIKVGSKVSFKGINVGEVIATAWYENELDLYKENNQIPVLIAIDSKASDEQFILDFYNNALKNKRLCASLSSSSLITSGNKIDLIFNESKCGFEYATYRNLPVIAAVSEGAITDQINSVLENIKAIDFSKLSSEMSKAMSSLDKLISNLDKVAKSVDDQKTVGNINEVLQKLNELLVTLNKTTGDYSKSSKFYEEVDRTLEHINSLINDLQPAIEKIGRNPNSIIFGAESTDPEIKVSK